jgi:threonine dehydratase
MQAAYLQLIQEARVSDVARETPLELQPNLSARLKNKVYLKREDMQEVFSFKIRGAYNKMAHLGKTELQRGVIAASAGNHAQGVALSAGRLGCRALIVMPATTPKIKVDAVRARGAEVVLHGESYSDAYQHALVLEAEQGLTFVHPYDDPLVIAGQGTIAREILAQHAGPLDAVFCCVGGGGLLAGVATYIKAFSPGTLVIGVEARDAAAMTLSLAQGRRVELEQVNLFADGAAVRQVGLHTFELCRRYVDEMIVVDNDQICAAIQDVFGDTRSILEPAGALAVAGIKAFVQKYGLEGKSLAGVASGANMNFNQLRYVAERAELGEQREALLAVTIPERPGAFKDFCQLLGRRNITEFNYRYADPEAAHIFVGITISSPEEPAQIMNTLAQNGLPALDLSGNEMAKLHLRHLVGGHAPRARHELIYRFEFPERPGALMKFLENMGENWNISLFHYRNQGADFGRVLAGIQVPPGDALVFRRFLEQLGYPHWDETENPANRLFLGGGAGKG